jgi:hypothetical protein
MVFLNCRSTKGAFMCPKGLPKSLKSHAYIGKQGEKLDDALIELRLADACSNFANRRFREGLSPTICDLLDKIFQHRLVHFGDNDEHIVNIPETILLSGIKELIKQESSSQNSKCVFLLPH